MALAVDAAGRGRGSEGPAGARHRGAFMAARAARGGVPTLREVCRQKVDTPNSVRSSTSSTSSTRNGSPYGTRINDP